VWQTAFLGDAVLTLPLVQALKAAWPGAEVHFFVRQGLETLFSAQPELASVRGFDKRGRDRSLCSAPRLGRALSREGFDLWISPHASFRSALVAVASGAPVRVGYDRPWWGRLAYTHPVSRRFAELEEIERLMELVRPLGLDPAPPAPRLVLPPAELEVARAWRKTVPGPLLGVHPGSTWPTKQWPAEYFTRVLELASAQGVATAVFGGPGAETELAGRIIAAARPGPGPFLNLAGTLSLPALAAHLGQLSACLTNDSGPMHLAWVQGAPTVALFGPTVRGLGFFPRGERSTVLEIDLPCRPCGLQDLAPETAWAVLRPRLLP
jgi:heptosyltransferase-2